MKREFFFDFKHKGLTYTTNANFELHKTKVYEIVVSDQMKAIANPFTKNYATVFSNTDIIFTCLN